MRVDTGPPTSAKAAQAEATEVILHCNYEENGALRAGGRSFLGKEPVGGGCVLAPPEERARVETLLARLEGDISITTLAELQEVTQAVAAIVSYLRAEMESTVVASHAAGEEAVAAYFEFAHALTVSHRLEEMESEMEAMIELVTGRAPDPHSAQTFRFPD